MNKLDLVDFYINELEIDEKIFNKIDSKSIILDNELDEIKDFIGCYYDNHEYKLYVPKINNLLTLLINIHEYSHAYVIEENIDISKDFVECIPISFERKYIKNKFDKIINNLQLNELNKIDDLYKYKKYILGYYYQFILSNLNIKEINKYKFRDIDVKYAYNESIKILKKG